MIDGFKWSADPSDPGTVIMVHPRDGVPEAPASTLAHE